MLTCFFDVDGPILLEWLPMGMTANTAMYCATLHGLRISRAIDVACCHACLSSWVIILVLIWLWRAKHCYCISTERFSNIPRTAQTHAIGLPHLRFFVQGIHHLVNRWDACVEQQDDFVLSICYVCILSFLCGRNSLVVRVMDSWLACHEFEPVPLKTRRQDVNDIVFSSPHKVEKELFGVRNQKDIQKYMSPSFLSGPTALESFFQATLLSASIL
ncbi:hypothetical protein TNCV_1410251 [Trichonephila clavipes]|nr:hypothetical protein TNCV_1410251 [Trichonephila clavipes]